MEKDSALCQLIDTRMNGVMNGIVSDDGKYQGILRKPDIYSGELGRMDLSKEIRLLVDQYVSEQNALAPGMGCSPTCLLCIISPQIRVVNESEIHPSRFSV